MEQKKKDTEKESQEKKEEKNEVAFDTKKLLMAAAAIVLVLVVFLGLSNQDSDTTEVIEDIDITGGDIVAEELIIEDLEVGTGSVAVSGKTVSVHYTGTLTDGTKFDSSLDRGTPFSFVLGAGDVIKGWDQGVAGMKIGGKRKLTIPSDLGYGDRGAGASIPPGATLLFEIELLSVE